MRKFLIAILILIGGVFYLFSNIAPDRQVIEQLLQGKPGQIYLLTDNPPTSGTVNNPRDIGEFHDLIRLKRAVKHTVPETKSLKTTPLLRFFYHDEKRGRSVTVDTDGRLFVSVDKSDIRNRSPLHWLWWKLDGVSDRHGYLYYVTEPDPQVAVLAKKLLSLREIGAH